MNARDNARSNIEFTKSEQDLEKGHSLPQTQWTNHNEPPSLTANQMCCSSKIQDRNELQATNKFQVSVRQYRYVRLEKAGGTKDNFRVGREGEGNRGLRKEVPVVSENISAEPNFWAQMQDLILQKGSVDVYKFLAKAIFPSRIILPSRSCLLHCCHEPLILFVLF
jgi:hypothetical protein